MPGPTTAPDRTAQHVTAVVVVDRRPELTVDAVQALLEQDRTPDRIVTVVARQTAFTPEDAGENAIKGPEGPVNPEDTRGADDAVGLDEADAGETSRDVPDLPHVLGVVARLADDAGIAYESLHARLAEVADRLPVSSSPESSWLWWIHDDARPAPDALHQLMTVVETSPSVTIAGCKQVELDRPRHLLDVGLSVTEAAEPVSLIEPGELDQGQYNARSDTFAVSEPGMLVRSDVWTELGGFDPFGPESAAVVDLCWRNRLAGHRVVVVPSAVVGHLGHGEGLFAGTAAVRESSLWLRLKHAAWWAVPLVWVWGLITGLGGFAAALLAKEPGRGGAFVAGTMRALARVLPLSRARSRARRTRTASRSIVAPLRAPRRDVRHYRRSVLDLESADEVIGDGTGSTRSDSEATGGHDDFAALATPERNWVGTGLVLILLLLGGLSVVGLRHLLGAPALSGGSLLPVSASPAELWNHALGSWSPSGVGAPVQPGPFGVILAVLGITGQGSLALLWLSILAMPLAAAGAWTAAGAVARNRGVRLLAALLWGLSPALFTAVGEGRPGALIVHLTLPWLALALIRATGSAALRRPDPEGTTVDTLGARNRPGHRGVVSWTASGWTALLLAGLGAAAPALLPVLVLVVLLIALLMRRRGRALWWTPLPAIALFLPALLNHWTDLRALLGDPGVPQAYDPAPLWQQVLGFPVAFAADSGLLALPWLDTALPGMAGSPWALVAALVIGVPVVILAVIGGILTGRVGWLARTSLGVSVLALAGTAVAPMIGIALDENGRLATLFTGPFTSTALMGLLIAAVCGLNGLLGLRGPRGAGLRAGRTARGTEERHGPVRRIVAVVLAVAGCCSVVLSAGLWVIPRTVPAETMDTAGTQALDQRAADGESDPTLSTLGTDSRVESSPVRLLPATAADQGTSPLGTRTVLLERQADELQVSLASGTGPTLDRLSAGWAARSLSGSLTSPTAAAPDRADEALRSLAAQLVSGANSDPRPALESFGAAFVVLRDPSGGELGTAASIDAVPGLAPVGLTDSGWLWRVVPEDDGGVPVAGSLGLEDRMGFSTARVRIEDGYGNPTHLVTRVQDQGTTVDTDIPSAEDSAGSRRLVLAERADAGWHATLDGNDLEPVSSAGNGDAADTGDAAWAQVFELPEHGGHLRVWHSSTGSGWIWWIPGILLLLAALLAIPSPARRTDTRQRTLTADGLGEPGPLHGSIDDHGFHGAPDDDPDWTRP
ncbi:glycosyltransferase [Citricoccus sp. GCM10030269]|uniref:glycosyltransferase family 2 protein n=1 Tax=Citricoccus sp. GCM10030269 TaxID=3273388 RepID=UPI00361B3706